MDMTLPLGLEERMYNANKDFDFIDFSSGIIKTIDAIRSKGKNGTTSNSVPIESRINAFYRAIGLPAINSSKPAGLPRNNGNLMKIDTVTPTLQTTILKLNQREDISSNLSDIIAAVGKGTFDFNTASITDSINEDKEDIRPQLFPMYVLDEIEISGLDRRVSGAFASEEYRRIDKTELHIPFLEFIISLRIKEAGVFNQATQTSLSNQIYGEFAAVSKDLYVELTSSLGNIGEQLTDIREKINRARINTSTQVAPDPSGHAEQNTDTADDPNAQAVLDKQQQDQERDIALKQARLLLFNFDDTTINGAIEAQSGQAVSITRNLKKSILASQFLNLVTSDSGAIADAKKETDSKKEKSKDDLKQAGGQLDFMLGTYSGLSGTDVMAVIYALFTIDIYILMSLLNDTARLRLKSTFNTDFSSHLIDMDKAVTKLEEKVRYVIEQVLKPRIDEDRQQNRKK
jgi:hypothetical protein